jgi:hypothetical protein
MTYRFIPIRLFFRDYKNIKKHNPDLSSDFDDFLNAFDHTQGNTVAGTNGAKKMRIAKSGKGKRGSYRIYYYFSYKSDVYLLRIYEKSVDSDLSKEEKKEIYEIVKTIKEQYPSLN